MNNFFKIIAVIMSIFCISCVNSNKASNDKTLELFFSKTDWSDFNSKTLTENKLNHFIDDKIDFYHREEFFKFMKNSDYNINYDDFYLVEIMNLNSEKITSRKIIAINYDNKITYLFFKDSQECSAKGNFSEAQINKYKYENLTVGTSKDGDSDVMVTKVTGDKY